MPAPDAVYLLDLCILAYQLHSQTLLWPLDPYAEQMQVKGAKLIGPGKRRMAFLRAAAGFYSQHRTGDASRANAPHLRGPANIIGANGWTQNDNLDPIVQDYDRLSPHRPGLVRPTRENDGWIIYRAPASITNLIKEVYVARYSAANGPASAHRQVDLTQLILTAPQGAQDLLYCFEGGTGGIEPGQGASWSLMGLVLAADNGNGYDLYIAFRGSRSGTLRPKRAITSRTGNPDWVSDLACQAETITEVAGETVNRGFARSILTMMPTIGKCLEDIQRKKKGPPQSVYVTGHSLGGALASAFASSVLLGDTWGPDAKGIPNALGAAWQARLRAMDVVTFAAPPLGYGSFAAAFNTQLGCQNFYLPGDPVVRSFGKQHGSQTRLTSSKIFGAAHEPAAIRKLLNEKLLLTIQRQRDAEEPWLVARNVMEAAKWLEENDPLKRKLKDLIPLDFKAGLIEYSLIYSGTLTAHDISGQLQTARNAINAFVAALRAYQGGTPQDLVPLRRIYATLVQNSPISEDKDLQAFLRAWLALVAAEAGVDLVGAKIVDINWIAQG